MHPMQCSLPANFLEANNPVELELLAYEIRIFSTILPTDLELPDWKFQWRL